MKTLIRVFLFISFTIAFAALYQGCDSTRKKAAAHYMSGKAFEKEGKINEATESYRSAIQLNPYHIQAHLEFQRLLLRAGRKKELLLYYEKLVYENQKVPAFYFLYGRLLDDPSERLEYYEKSLSYDPSFVWSIDAIGVEFFIKGDYDEAIKRFHKILEIDSEFAPMHIHLSRTFLQKGEVDDAYREVEKFLQLEPDSAPGYNQLGYVMRTKGNNQKAIDAWKKSLQLAPDKADVMTEIGYSYYELKDYERARNYLGKGALADPDYAKLHYVYALINEAEGNLEEALREIRVSLSIKPEDVRALVTLGGLLFKKGDLNKAKKSFEEALLQNPRDTQALIFMAQIYEEEGDLERAIEANRSALSVNSRLFQAHRNLGFLLMKKGEIEKAIGEYEGLMKDRFFHPLPEDHFNLGLLYWEKGILHKAEQQFIKAVTMRPKNMNFLLRIELMGDVKGRKEEASKILLLISRENPIPFFSKEYLGASMLQAEDHEAALKLLSDLPGSQKDSSFISLHLAIAYNGKKKRDEALKALAGALKNLDNKKSLLYGMIMLNTGRITIEAGKPDKGIGHLKKAQTIREEQLLQAMVYFEMARAYAEKKALKEASYYLEKSIEMGFANKRALQSLPALSKER